MRSSTFCLHQRQNWIDGCDMAFPARWPYVQPERRLRNFVFVFDTVLQYKMQSISSIHRNMECTETFVGVASPFCCEKNQTLCYFIKQSSSSSIVRNKAMKWEETEMGSPLSMHQASTWYHRATPSIHQATKKKQRVRFDESKNETFEVIGYCNDVGEDFKTIAWYSQAELKRIRADVTQDIQSLCSSHTSEIYKSELLELMESVRIGRRPIRLYRYVALLLEDDRRCGLIFRQVPTVWRLRRHYVLLSRTAVIKSTTPAELSTVLSRTNRLMGQVVADALHLSISTTTRRRMLLESKEDEQSLGVRIEDMYNCIDILPKQYKKLVHTRTAVVLVYNPYYSVHLSNSCSLPIQRAIIGITTVLGLDRLLLVGRPSRVFGPTKVESLHTVCNISL
jgi:hypothetical protein